MTDEGFDEVDGRNTWLVGLPQLLYYCTDLALFFEEEGDFSSVDPQFVEGSVAVIDCIREEIPKFLVEVVVGTHSSGGQIQAAESLFEKLPVFFVGNGPPYLSADFIELPFPDVEDTHEFLFEDFELSELIEPFLTSQVIGALEFDSLFHEFMNFLVEEGDLNDLAALFDVPGGAAGANKDIFILEALGAAADHVGFLIMFDAQLGAENLHLFAL